MLLGNAAAQHPQAGALLALAQWIAAQTGASVGYLGEAANSVGAQLVGALPAAGGLNAGQMLSQGMKALLLLNTEPVLDAADAAAAHAPRCRPVGLVVALTAFKDAAVDNADVLLPIAPFTETAGSFVNAEGRLQASTASSSRWATPARPGRCCACWATCSAWTGFEHESAEQVRAEALGDVGRPLAARLDNRRPRCPPRRPADHGRRRCSAWPTCRSTPPTPWCAAPNRCS
jgi:NADH-quinone oxidoreductase subunit G